MGSIGQLNNSEESSVSQAANRIQQKPCISKDAMMITLSQAYTVPDSSSAKISMTEAARDNILPGQSIRRRLRTLIFNGISFLGRTQNTNKISASPRGTLHGGQLFKSSYHALTRQSTHLSQKTHRQLPCEVIAPPIGGPATLDNAKIEDIIPATGPMLLPGTSVVMVMAML